MRNILQSRRRGQALLMVTLALVSMCGLMGLAVDLGWSFFVRKAAQAAADAAALAAVEKAVVDSGGVGSLICGTTGLTCSPTPAHCDSLTGNLHSACLYARQNGFIDNGGTGPQGVGVTVQADVTSPPPTAPGVSVQYWVTVRVTQRVPQLFSAVLGNTTSLVSARATAAIADVVVIGTLRLLNRQNDVTDPKAPTAPPPGVDLNMGGLGSAHLRVPGGILLSSTSTGAGTIKGGGTVETPWTFIRGANGRGGLDLSNNATWTNGFQNKPDGDYFHDPFSNKGQPPLTSAPLQAIPVPGGTLNSTVCPGGICAPGNYFATGPLPGCTSACPQVATGAPIIVGENLSFGTGSNFGDFNFFGGLQIGQAAVNFAAGRYAMAGVLDPSTTNVFDTNNKALITGGAGPNTDAGRIFILTDSTYPGLATQVAQIDAAVGGSQNRLWTQLNFAPGELKAGSTSGSGITLNGLNKSQLGSISDTNAQGHPLKDFGPVVIWQDQRNSNVKYTPNGNIDISCGSLDSPCTNPQADRHMGLMAGQANKISGLIYQPRGAWMVLQGGSNATAIGPLSMISGALNFQGGTDMTLDGPEDPLTVPTVALVE